MKNIFLILGIVLISLTSCQITEKIYLEEDGSGKYNMEIDMSSMIKSLGKMGSKEEIDSTYVAKDSIINFSDMLIEHKDSIAKLPKEKQEQLQKMKDVQMIIHEDKAKNEFSLSIVGVFKNTEELNNLQNILNATQPDEKQIPSKYDIKYAFKKNRFSRKSNKKELTEEQLAKFDESIKGFEMFLSGTTYKLEYHFPKTIKKTTLKDAQFSEDKKTLYIEKSINDWINNPTVFDFKVKLK